MKKSRFSEEQIAHAIRQAESGSSSAVEICRKMGVSEQTFYRWKKIYTGMGITELRRLRQVEEENRKLKRLVADLSLDKHMLQEVVAKKALKPHAKLALVTWLKMAFGPVILVFRPRGGEEPVSKT